MSEVKVVPFVDRRKADSVSDIYSQALLIKKKRSGIDYNKIYNGKITDKQLEKNKQIQLRKKEKMETWYLEG